VTDRQANGQTNIPTLANTGLHIASYADALYKSDWGSKTTVVTEFLYKDK